MAILRDRRRPRKPLRDAHEGVRGLSTAEADLLLTASALPLLLITCPTGPCGHRMKHPSAAGAGHGLSVRPGARGPSPGLWALLGGISSSLRLCGFQPEIPKHLQL